MCFWLGQEPVTSQSQGTAVLSSPCVMDSAKPTVYTFFPFQPLLREEPTTFPLAWGQPYVTTPSPSWAQLTCRGMTEVPHYGKAGASSTRPSFLEVLMVQPLWPQEGNGQQCRHEHSRALGWHTQGAHKARPPSQDPGGAVRSSAPLFLTYHCPLAVWAQP